MISRNCRTIRSASRRMSRSAVVRLAEAAPADSPSVDAAPHGLQLRAQAELHEHPQRADQLPPETRARAIRPRPAHRSAPAVDVARMPLSIARVRMPWTIGKVPAFLMSISSEPTPTDAMMRARARRARGVVEGLDQVGEPRQERCLAAHELDQRRPWPARAGPMRPVDGDRVEEDGEVHGGIRVARQHPGLDLADEAVDRLRPDRVADHDVAGAGREAEAVQRAGKGLAERARDRSPAPGRPAGGRCPGRSARSARRALPTP